jgi:hypothetical protein
MSWEESNSNSFHTDRVRGRLKLVFIIANSDGSTLTLNSASTPGTSVSNVGNTVSFTFPKGDFVQPAFCCYANTAAGFLGHFTALSATAGTGTLAATGLPLSGGTLHLTFFVGRTG